LIGISVDGQSRDQRVLKNELIFSSIREKSGASLCLEQSSITDLDGYLMSAGCRPRARLPFHSVVFRTVAGCTRFACHLPVAAAPAGLARTTPASHREKCGFVAQSWRRICGVPCRSWRDQFQGAPLSTFEYQRINPAAGLISNRPRVRTFHTIPIAGSIADVRHRA